jgi:hypothetical protein
MSNGNANNSQLKGAKLEILQGQMMIVSVVLLKMRDNHPCA